MNQVYLTNNYKLTRVVFNGPGVSFVPRTIHQTMRALEPIRTALVIIALVALLLNVNIPNPPEHAISGIGIMTASFSTYSVDDRRVNDPYGRVATRNFLPTQPRRVSHLIGPNRLLAQEEQQSYVTGHPDC